MKRKRFFIGLIFSALPGCATYELQPLTMTHPANAQAAAAPAVPTSKTLAYSQADLPTINATGAPQSGREGPHPDAKSKNQKNVVGEGKVIATVPSASQLVVEHGEIKGFMDAMTMGYKVTSPGLLKGMRPGDTVQFTIDTDKRVISKITKVQPPTQRKE